jgi:hypothetical protein
MKYLKLFEAFESTILSKTLSFIKDEESKKQFMFALDKICSTIDYPKSELKDEYFQYLSFYPALKLSAKTGDEPCEALSRDSYPDYAVDGAKCKGGKVLRKWGARTREVECSICKGTGVKPKKPEIKLVKFWFSTEGKYIAVTAVDGLIRNTTTSSTARGYSKDYQDYIVVNTTEDSRELQTGMIVRVTINGRPTICYIVKDRNTYPYAIQDEHSGSTPDNIPSRNWRNFGHSSWHLSRGEYRGTIEILEPKSKEEVIVEPNPYTWNATLSLSGYSGMKVDIYSDVQEKIKDANFAIVLDFGKMKQSEFKTTYSTRSEREESRTGALALEKPEDIKATNIERYIKSLSDKVASGDELTKVTRVIPRLMGGRNILLYIGMNRNLSTIDSLATRLYRFITEDEDNKEYNAREIVATIKNSYKQNLQFTTDLNEVLDEVRKQLQKPGKEAYLSTFDKMLEISQKINDKVFSTEVKSIEDIEYIYQKLRTIQNMLQSSRNPANRLRYFMERLSYLTTDRCVSRILEIDQDEIPSIIEGLESIGRFVERV